MSRAATIPADVQRAYDSLPAPQRETLMAVRDMILEVGKGNAEVGEIEEALRWGEPAYLTTQSKSGSTIRLGVERNSGKPAIFFNCKTTLVEEFRDQFGDTLQFSKNRAILLEEEGDIAADVLRICNGAALSYHKRGK